MIGFDEFIILNHNSTDDTHCLLDAYEIRGIVKLIPTHVEDVFLDDDTASPTMKSRVDRIFDTCAIYLSNNNDSKVWMLTHDVDEFVYFHW